MCSHNTTNSLDGHASSAANASVASGHNHHHEYASSSFRKPKKPRIPKRGPGVAELEKILREQENKYGEEKEKISIGRISSSLVPLPKTTYLRPRSSNGASSSHPLSKSVPLFSDHSHLADAPSHPVTTMPACSVNVNDNLKGTSQFEGGSKAVYICKAGIYLPQEALLPVPWGSYEKSKGEKTPKTDSDFSFPILVSKGMDHSKSAAPPMFQNSDGPSHSSLMNKFPWSSMSSSSRPSSSAGVFHEEPPSSQKSCHNHTVLSEKDKMIGAKRPRPIFPVDNWPPAPPPTSPCQHSPFHRHIHRLDPSSSSSSSPSNHGAINFATSSRDPMLPSSSSELKLQKCANDHGNPRGSGSGNGLAFRSPTTPLPSTENCQPNFSKFKQFSFQEMKENSVEGLLHQNPSSSSAGSEGSVDQKKSFISFLLDQEEQSGAAADEATLSGLINDKFAEEEGAEFIDLNLKL